MFSCLAGVAGYAATGPAVLRTNDPIVRLGAPVWVRVDITNLSGALQQGAVGPGSHYEFKIVDRTSGRILPRVGKSTSDYDSLRFSLASSYLKQADTLASVAFQLDQMYEFARPGRYDVTGTGGSLQINGKSVTLPPSNTITITLTAPPAFSAAPTIPVRDYDLQFAPDIQRLNGLFVLRLIQQMSLPRARACLRLIDDSTVTLEAFDTGAVRAETSVKSCADSLNVQAAHAPATSTGRVSISGARILAMILADERFNQASFFAANDHNLAHYDVEVFDRKGFIDVHFQPSYRTGTTVLWVGCPPVGPTSAGYFVDPKTFAVKSFNAVC